ncbi:hypothetical protein HNW13_023185 [Shewanella sp. BF02_Schw]|uniref:hypothetical protein n=1 Tax=Shewanella sp. BF02_Schw TaxID=394908 RepID=UPI00178658AA|nr:hypothetical protein [Shewanella sp. BF02_Schw]MBO1898648.1 hypothetical protein [Shewanella sp. BF02_Schw]
MTTTQEASYQQLKALLECYFTIDDQDYLIPVLLSFSGDAKKVISWFTQEPIPAFGNITALGVCVSGDGKLLIDYIKSIQMGGYA